MPWKALNETYRRTAQCTQGEERKRRRLVEQEDREVTDRDFRAYERPHGDGGLLQIPGAGYPGDGRRLDGGDEELGLSKEVLE